jgi:hydroxyacylglutathione hydrolase
VILKQYYLGCLAHASYLIADEASGEAAVVDPQLDVDDLGHKAMRSVFTLTGNVPKQV